MEEVTTQDNLCLRKQLHLRQLLLQLTLEIQLGQVQRSLQRLQIYNDTAAGDPLVVVLDFGGDKTCTNGTFKITYPDPTTPANAIISMS